MQNYGYGLNDKATAQSMQNHINDTNMINAEVIETADIDEKVSPNSYFALKKYYGECGHYDIQYSELPIELINLTKENINSIYEGWEVEEFSSNLVVLSTEIDGLCGEHYLIKLQDRYIEVYNLGRDGSLKLYKQTDITREYLTEKDIKTLEEGLNVYGKGKANSIIEDFE